MNKAKIREALEAASDLVSLKAPTIWLRLAAERKIEAALAALDEYVYHASTGCTTDDGRHDFEEAEAPYYRRCTACGKLFYLIEAELLKEMGIRVVERPLTKQ